MWFLVYIKNQTGDEPQKQDTQANKRSPLLRFLKTKGSKHSRPKKI